MAWSPWWSPLRDLEVVVPAMADSKGTREAVRLPSMNTLSGAEAGLVPSVFLACAVEAVEALTIVLAVG